VQVANRDSTVTQLQDMLAESKQHSSKAIESLQGQLRASERICQSQVVALDQARDNVVCPTSISWMSVPLIY
jgi:hypothetical protein